MPSLHASHNWAKLYLRSLPGSRDRYSRRMQDGGSLIRRCLAASREFVCPSPVFPIGLSGLRRMCRYYAQSADSVYDKVKGSSPNTSAHLGSRGEGASQLPLVEAIVC